MNDIRQVQADFEKCRAETRVISTNSDLRKALGPRLP